MKTLNIHMQDNVLEKIKERLFNGVILIDPNKTNYPIIDVNSTFEKMSGYRSEELLYKNIDFLQKNDFQNKENKVILDAISMEKECKITLRHYKKDESLFYNELHLSPIYDDEKLLYYLVVCNDVTTYIEQINLIDNKNKNELQNIRKRDLRDFETLKMKSSSILMSNIAHQWRQPLNIISMSASSMGIEKQLNSLDDEKFRMYVDNILNNTNYLTSIINDFSSTYKYYNNNYENRLILDEVKSAVEIVNKALENSKIDFIIDIDESIDLKRKMNLGQLTQVVIDILDNAKDAILLRSIQKPWIKLVMSLNNAEVLISIEDNAGGINKEIITEVFEPYSSSKHKFIGVGLGLNKCYRIINELLDGKLNVINSENGAKFTIGFNTTLEMENIKVLYVEDNHNERVFFERILKRYIPNIVSFSNGFDAFEEYKYSKDYDLIISDIKMPIMDGVEFIRSVRCQDSKIPIIAISAFFDEYTLKNMKIMGVSTTIEKPTKIDKILKKIKDIINTNLTTKTA